VSKIFIKKRKRVILREEGWAFGKGSIPKGRRRSVIINKKKRREGLSGKNHPRGLPIAGRGGLVFPGKRKTIWTTLLYLEVKRRGREGKVFLPLKRVTVKRRKEKFDLSYHLIRLGKGRKE